jgi:hypothetical protein
MSATPELSNLLIGAQWRERQLIDEIKNKDTAGTDRYKDLDLLKALATRVWENVCEHRLSIKISHPVFEVCKVVEAKKVMATLLPG